MRKLFMRLFIFFRGLWLKPKRLEGTDLPLWWLPHITHHDLSAPLSFVEVGHPLNEAISGNLEPHDVKGVWTFEHPAFNPPIVLDFWAPDDLAFEGMLSSQGYLLASALVIEKLWRPGNVTVGFKDIEGHGKTTNEAVNDLLDNLLIEKNLLITLEQVVIMYDHYHAAYGI